MRTSSGLQQRHARALVGLALAAVCLHAPAQPQLSDNLPNRQPPALDTPAQSLASASPEAVIRSFTSVMLGRWGSDCTRIISSYQMDGGNLQGETFYNGQVGTRSTIRTSSVKYAGMSNNLHRFEYRVDSRAVPNGESHSNRIIMETDLRTVRRTVYSEQLGSNAVLIREGILVATSAPMPMQRPCT